MYMRIRPARYIYAAHDCHQRRQPYDAAGGVKTPSAYSPSHRVGNSYDELMKLNILQFGSPGTRSLDVNMRYRMKLILRASLFKDRYVRTVKIRMANNLIYPWIPKGVNSCMWTCNAHADVQRLKVSKRAMRMS